MTRDQVLTHIKYKNLKSKLYWSENLTLSKLLEVVSQYRDQDALILAQPEVEINRVGLTEKTTSVMKFQGRLGHFAVCCRYHSEHASNKNHTTSQQRTSLQTKGGRRREKLHAVTQ